MQCNHKWANSLLPGQFYGGGGGLNGQQKTNKHYIKKRKKKKVGKAKIELIIQRI
jgi:hypothetical protein